MSLIFLLVFAEGTETTFLYEQVKKIINDNADTSLDKAAPDVNFTNYTYNPNSLIDYQHFNGYQIENNFQYNSRNWLTSFENSLGQFSFFNTYFKNGNLETQLILGTYKDYMQNRYNLHYNYSYDNSNRLLNALNTNQGDNTYSVYNTYDNDGNITTLKRYGDNNTLTDDFNYQYYPGTNKVRTVSGLEDQFNYDLNGNTTKDTVNYNFNIKYDYRNLITELYHKDPESVSRPNTYATRYYYDESGNRVRKLVYFTSQANPPPVIDWNNPGNGWQLRNNEFYVKGVDGKDLATYQGNILDEWFVWANDLVGKIKGNKQYYYYKDHLGSVRVVVDNAGAIVAGYDYDAWGYPLENRNYNGDSIKYKYTGKELDKESFYDYFGARYYDARIGNFGSVDPMLEKHYDFSPYNYVLRNPLRLIDPDGAQIESIQNFLNIYSWYTNEKIHNDYYSGLSLVGKEQYKREQPSYSTGSIESAAIQPGDLIAAPVGIMLASKFPIFAKTTLRFTVEENIGVASDISLDWVQGAKVNSKNIKKLGNELEDFLGESIDFVEDNSSRVKYGNIRKTGKEVRIGPDVSHPYFHIDIERNAIGKKYKDLKLKITIPQL